MKMLKNFSYRSNVGFADPQRHHIVAMLPPLTLSGAISEPCHLQNSPFSSYRHHVKEHGRKYTQKKKGEQTIHLFSSRF